MELDAIKDAPKDSLTIVIPSKGRPLMLAALLGYFSSACVQYRILVLLSGSRNSYLPGAYPGLDLNVMEFEENINFYEKLASGLEKVSTPLVAMCTDDDIVLHDALKKAGGYLLQNPEYTACQGYHALFSEVSGVVNLTSIAYFTPSLEAEDPLTRLNELIRRYQPICWAVFRTKIMTEVAELSSMNLNFSFQELLWSTCPVLSGKVKRLPMIYCLRRIDDISLEGHPIYAMMESPQKFFSEYISYRNTLVGFLSNMASFSKAELERMVDLIHACFFGRVTVPSTLYYFTEQVLSNPAASIHDPEIARVLRGLPSNLTSGWAQEIVREGLRYRIFPEFRNPEPKSEIHLKPDFVQQTVSDIHAYFRPPADLSTASAQEPPVQNIPRRN